MNYNSFITRHVIFLLISGNAHYAFAEEPFTQEDAKFVQRAKEWITREFKDPNSALFRNMFLGATGTERKTLCGEVNGKNSYGGYVGYRRFVSSPDLPPNLSTIDDGGFSLYGVFCKPENRIKTVP